MKLKKKQTMFIKTSQDIWETENEKPQEDLKKLKSNFIKKMGT